MQKSCAQCEQQFEITDEDIAFYDKVSPVFNGKKYQIPPPALCPDCRQRRRLAFRNERHLYPDQCDLCKKNMISLYSPDKPYKVFCQACWWGDGWDPADYGREFDPDRPFFEQFAELRLQVPRLAIFNLQSVNSEYTNHAFGNRNCYMGVALGECEDCMYSQWLLNSRDCLDMLYCEYCEQCYGCFYCGNCHLTFYAEQCRNTHESLMCFECRDCENCIGCVQLRHKKYHIFNEPVSKEAFESYRREILTSREKFSEAWGKFNALKLGAPRRSSLQINCENSTGNDLYNCRNLKNGFNCHRVEDSKYMIDTADFKDSMDCYECGWGKVSELMYDVHGGHENTHNLFCNTCSNCSEMTYSELCFNGSADLFGCVSMNKRQYCVLNRRYTEDEYRELVPRIIGRMTRDGEWGEFMPARLSPFGYNESAGMQYFPMNESEADALNFRWSPYEPQLPDVKAVDRTDLPDDIAKVNDSILDVAIKCESSGRPFRIIRKELEFYRRYGIPLPRKHPDERHKDRFAQCNPRKLYDRACAKCQAPIRTAYAPERTEKVYCESCYLKEVY